MCSAPVGNIWQPRENNNNLRSSFVSRISPCKIAGTQNHYNDDTGSFKISPCQELQDFTVFLRFFGAFTRITWAVGAITWAKVAAPCLSGSPSARRFAGTWLEVIHQLHKRCFYKRSWKSLGSLQKGQAIWPVHFFCMLCWLLYTTSPWAGHVQLT